MVAFERKPDGVFQGQAASRTLSDRYLLLLPAIVKSKICPSLALLMMAIG